MAEEEATAVLLVADSDIEVGDEAGKEEPTAAALAAANRHSPSSRRGRVAVVLFAGLGCALAFASIRGGASVAVQASTDVIGLVMKPATQRYATPSPVGSGLANKDPCNAGEEYFDGLCYASCETLTSYALRKRISGCSCCSSVDADCSQKDNVDVSCNTYNKDGNGKLPRIPTPLAIPGPAPDGKPRSNSTQTCNVCAANEEYFQGVCYKQCAILTNGEYPVRTEFCTCAKGDSLTEWASPANYKTYCPAFGSAALKSYNVDGLGGNPRVPNTDGMQVCNPCEPNYELFSGLCYEACSVVSNGNFPIRVSHCTCGTQESSNPFTQKTSQSFCRGGGKNLPHFLPSASYLTSP